MPSLSKKGMNMPASPIRKLVPYAEGAKSRSVKVYHLNIGQPDIASPKIAIDAIKSMNDTFIEYGHSAGNESYRRALARFYKKYDINVDYSDILVTTGGSEALMFVLHSCLNVEDELLIPEPYYANYNSFATMAGVTVTTITSKIDNDFALPTISEFEAKITPKTKAILICNPNNPTGYLYSQEELEQLKEIALKYDLFLIFDEVYREFCYDGAIHTSILSLEGLDEHAIVVDSVSKRYSMCGARIGALISKNKEVIDAALRIAQARLCPPAIEQLAAEAAIDTPDSYFETVYNEYVERRDVLVERLNKIEGVYCPKPKGAFYAIVELPIDDSDKFSQWLLEEFSYKNQTVMLAPATGFYADAKLGRKQVRIAYVLKKEDLIAATECLEVALKEYNANNK